jgi:prepilin-type N-terminal cleavage/methylation domain-containing protein
LSGQAYKDFEMQIKKINHGFTLLELMIVMVIVAIGVALATPTFQDITQRRQTTAQAEELAAFLSYAQSEAVKKNTPISVELKYTSSSDWCVGAAETLTGCACKGTGTACTIEGVNFTMGSATQKHSSLVAPALLADKIFAFDPIRGTMITGDLANAHFFTMQSDNAKYRLRVDVGATGRIKICNPVSTKAVPGYKPCT